MNRDRYEILEYEGRLYSEIQHLESENDDLKKQVKELQQENKQLKEENEKLTQLWLESQNKRREGIKYLKQPYRDNFDFSKARLLEILGDKENE